MVLLVEQIVGARRTHHVVDAMADLAVARRSRVVVAGVSWPGLERRLRRSQVSPPSSVAKTPAAEMPTQSLSGLVRVGTMVCRTKPGRSGIPVVGGGMIGQSLDPCPRLAPVVALVSRLAGLVPAIEPPMRVAE